jgi:circadian clock protein KaiC
MQNPSSPRDMAATGITGLDDILAGGFAADRLFLIEGVPGSGKTTLALQFLMAGAAAGEPVLYVTLSETKKELESVAASHGWDLSGIPIHELTPPETELEPDEQNTMFHPSEIELVETIKQILADVDALKPRRLVLDSLSELRLLAGSPLRYRRQILALKQFFATRACTVLLLDDLTATDHDLQMRSIAHGVVLLEQLSPEYGADRRRLRVLKYRGSQFRGGYHDYVIRKGGIVAFPRLVAAEHRNEGEPRRTLPSKLAALDALLGGGLGEGTSTLIVGPAGTGKSTLGVLFAVAAVERGERAALFLFDENSHTLIARCEALGVDIGRALASGKLTLQQIDPAELTPGELSQEIRQVVANGAKIVIVDSLNGYLNAMPQERFLTIQLHELLSYLAEQRVATILIAAHHGLIGTNMQSPVDASYLADAVVLLRYFETGGEVRQAISVMKKRGSQHERTIRELRFENGGIKIGEALRHFRGVLTGVPVYEGARSGEGAPP